MNKFKKFIETYHVSITIIICSILVAWYLGHHIQLAAATVVGGLFATN